MVTTDLDYKSFDGTVSKDYPDFVDSFIESAQFTDGTELTESELEWLNEQGDIVYQWAMDYWF